MAEGNGRTWSPEIMELGDKIVALTVAKAVELGNYLEEKHGIKPAAAGVAVAAAPAAAVLCELACAPERSAETDVWLEAEPETCPLACVCAAAATVKTDASATTTAPSLSICPPAKSLF